MQDLQTLKLSEVTIKWDTTNEKQFYVNETAQSWHYKTEESPLNRRAWCMQERLLAPHVLDFAKDQIFSECQELESCEMYPNGIPEHLTTRAQSMMALRHLTSSSGCGISTGKDGEEQPGLVLYEFWYQVMTMYSKGDLTFPHDKLIALYDMALEVQYRFKDKYLAGLRRSCLPYFLLWSVNHREPE